MPRLAKEAKVGKHAANVALRERVGQITVESNETQSQLLATMQKEALKARTETLRRLNRVAVLVDRVADRLEKDISDHSEPGTDKYGNDVLTSPGLAKAAATLANASEKLWATVKDATGLALSEDAAKVALRSTGKKPNAPLVPGVLVELDDSGEREDS